MTKVESTNAQTQNPYSVFGSITKGIVGGGITGYAAKYMLPLSEAEMDAEYKIITEAIRERSKELKGLPIEAIRNLEQKTPAQDVFIKMVDAQAQKNDGGIIRTALNAINIGSKESSKASTFDRGLRMKSFIEASGLDAQGIKELKNIIAQVNEKATKSCKNYIDSFNASVKKAKRPAVAFITAGAVVGFFAGLAHKVIAGQPD